MRTTPFAAVVLLISIVLVGALWAAEPSQRAKDHIAAIEQILPECERAANAGEQALQPFLNSQEPKTILAVDGARLMISAIRSIRTIIAKQPDLFAWNLGADAIKGFADQLQYFLGCAAADKDPFAGMTSGVRPLRSAIDGQILFYLFRLPKDYDPNKRYPVRVDLHSGAALIWRAGWVGRLRPSANPMLANQDATIWISPCGRGNNSYTGMGEVAVVEAITDLIRNYAVDENRIVIGGASMGGSGGFRLCALHPDLFAAGHSLTGGAAYGMPPGNPYYNAYLLPDNLCNTAFCIWDAPKEGHYKDNNAFAEALRGLAQKYPGSYPSLELTDEKGGHGIIDRKLQARGWEWINRQVRNPWPRRVIYKTYGLRHDGAYWAYIDTVQDAEKPARIEAELQDGGALRVAVENVGRFHLDLARELVGGAKEVIVAINGGEPCTVPAGKTAYFAQTDGKWQPSAQRYPPGLVKRHALSGPIYDVFMGEPVLFIYGTAKGQDVAERQGTVDRVVLQLFGPEDGGVTLHTGFERKADSEVTQDDIARKHLVLLGTPEQNQLLARMVPKLPVQFTADGVRLGEKSYPGAGVVMVYPNPLNPDRYILLLPEGYTGGDARHHPDYIVATFGERMRVLEQGWFDARWENPHPARPRSD